MYTSRVSWSPRPMARSIRSARPISEVPCVRCTALAAIATRASPRNPERLRMVTIVGSLGSLGQVGNDLVHELLRGDRAAKGPDALLQRVEVVTGDELELVPDRDRKSVV